MSGGFTDTPMSDKIDVMAAHRGDSHAIGQMLARLELFGEGSLGRLSEGGNTVGNAMLPGYIRWLLDEDQYTHDASEIVLKQTHISYVILVGKYVYKWKKNVDFGFLDFSTLAQRKFYCEEELVLNQRLCPEIYLEVVTLTIKGAGYEFNGDGEIVEYGVKMLRLPEHRMMCELLHNNQVGVGEIERIVTTLVPFYAKARSGEGINEYGLARSVAVNIEENLEQIKKYVGTEVLPNSSYNLIRNYTNEILAEEHLFSERIEAGKIHDCHGDLHSGNICLAEKVYIFDCIEFSKRLRYSDVAADIAFLAMDLDFHGLREQSSHLINFFIRESQDETLGSVLDFYKCYRAVVRGKISLLTADDAGMGEEMRHQYREQAWSYFSLAEKYCLNRG